MRAGASRHLSRRPEPPGPCPSLSCRPSAQEPSDQEERVPEVEAAAACRKVKLAVKANEDSKQQAGMEQIEQGGAADFPPRGQRSRSSSSRRDLGMIEVGKSVVKQKRKSTFPKAPRAHRQGSSQVSRSASTARDPKGWGAHGQKKRRRRSPWTCPARSVRTFGAALAPVCAVTLRSRPGAHACKQIPTNQLR